jgi:hypothetical protein
VLAAPQVPGRQLLVGVGVRLGGSRRSRSCLPSEAALAAKRLAGVAMPSDWCGRSQL